MTNLETSTHLLPSNFSEEGGYFTRVIARSPLSGMLVVRFCVDKNRGTRKPGHCELRVEQTQSPASLLRLEAIRRWVFLKFGNGMPLAAHDLGEGSRVFS